MRVGLGDRLLALGIKKKRNTLQDCLEFDLTK